MAGIDNLVPLTTEKAREIGRLGGIASGEAKQQRKTLKETLLLMLEQGDTQDNITLALLQKAMTGDTKAFEVIRDSIGEKQIEVKEIIDNRTDSKLDKLIDNIDKLKDN